MTRRARLNTSALFLVLVIVAQPVAQSPATATVAPVICVARTLVCDRETTPLSDIDAADPSVILLSTARGSSTYVVFSTADQHAGAEHRDDITREKLTYSCTGTGCRWSNGTSSEAVAAPSWDVDRCPMGAPGVFKTGSHFVMWFDMASAEAPQSCFNKGRPDSGSPRRRLLLPLLRH